MKTSEENVVTLGADSELFGRLSYVLSTVPSFLDHPDGSLKKTNKMSTDYCEMSTAHIFDAMHTYDKVCWCSKLW